MLISINPTLNRYLSTLTITDPEARKHAISIKCAYGWEPIEYEWGQDIFHNILCPSIFYTDHKTTENAAFTTGFMVDVDNPQEVDAEYVITELNKQELAYAFIFTANNWKDKKGVTCERYRVFLPFDDAYEIDPHHKEKILMWIASNPAFSKLSIDKDGIGVHRYFFVGSEHAITDGRFLTYKEIQAIQLPVVKRVSVPLIAGTSIPKDIQELINNLQPNSRSSATCTIAGKLKHYSQQVKDLALNECILRGIDDAAVRSFKKYSVGEDRSIDTSSLEGIMKLQKIARRNARK